MLQIKTCKALHNENNPAVWNFLFCQGMSFSDFEVPKASMPIRGKNRVNSLTTVGYLLEVFFRLWIPFLVRISTSAWSQQWKLELKLLWHHLLGFMTLTTPTHLRAFNGQGSPTIERSSWLKASYRFRNGVPTRWEEWFLSLFMLTRREMVQPLPTKAPL